MDHRPSGWKVLAIAVPVLALVGYLLWMSYDAGRRAEVLAGQVVVPYLEAIRARDYRRALEAYGTEAHRKRITEPDLAAAYAELASRHGPLTSFELVSAQKQAVIGGDSWVHARYRLTFARGMLAAAYDVKGEGDAARIDASYVQDAAGKGLIPAPR
ncbi:MAG: hypothetical protein KIT84_13615 [Labilithrix sp.]|nr:hypothetical protein [Labilithrix sp.]MCW5812056.1 hypothetical protein [Labilithrix sp.]